MPPTSNNGFMLPSLTNARPTVSLSGVETTTSPIISKVTHDGANDSNDDVDASDNLNKVEKMIESLLVTEEAETVVKEEDIEAEEDEDDEEVDVSQNTPVSTATTGISTTSGPTLKSLMDARGESKAIGITKQETKGKGMLLDESSEEEEEEEEKEKKDGGEAQLLQPPEESKDESSSEEISISEEKVNMEEMNNRVNDEQNVQVQDKEEELINETLDDDDDDDDDANANEVEDEAESVKEDAINKEVEEEVNKVKLSNESGEDVTSQNSKIRLIDLDDGEDNKEVQTASDKIQYIKQRSNSIKFIPNPPSNLSKQRAFDFQEFLVQFKSKECEPIHKYLKSFIRQFAQRIWTVNEQVKLIKEFEEFLFNKLIQYEPFNQMNNDENKINNCKEGLEKLILTKVYPVVFSPCMSFIKLTDSHKHDKLMDKKCLTNSYLYDWIELRHLDLNINVKVDSKFIMLASKELSKIDDFKSPRDKIVCILNSSKLIFGLIRQQEKPEENADSFVPLLIYILIHSKVKHLYSNLQYIERFRNEEFLIGETSYYVSTMQIACNFIINITKDQLTVDDSEYESAMQKSRARLETAVDASPSPSPSEVLTKSAEMVKQSLSHSITSIINNIQPEQNAEPPRVGASASSSALAQARAESLAEARQNEERALVVAQLVGMFPGVEAQLVGDVARECRWDASQCVDALLELQ